MSYYAQILLADDDEDDRLFFEEALEDLKVESKIEIFEDGHYLMEYIQDNNPDIPNIIFLDLNMPLKSGRDCLRELKKSNNTENTVIAIYSTSSSNSDIESTYKDGASLYIKKPNSFSDLKKVLQQVISKYWNANDEFSNYVFSAL